MRVSYRKRVLLREETKKQCNSCNEAHPQDSNFCPKCGSKLELATIKVYANISKNGVTSISYQTPNGTINSKGTLSVSVGNGFTLKTGSASKAKDTTKKRDG